MDSDPFPPKGIWMEVSRNRWRVKLFCDGVLFHRSYHSTFEEALTAWQVAKKRMRLPREAPEATPINKFLYQPLVGAGRGFAAD